MTALPTKKGWLMTERELELIELYEALPPNEKAAILEVVRVFALRQREAEHESMPTNSPEPQESTD